MGYEYPPILQGSSQQQLQALRDYLVRMARSLEAAEKAPAIASAASTGTSTATKEKKTEEDKLAALRRNAANLRALIVKTAGEVDTVSADLGATRQEMESYYLAKSDFGTYMEQAEAAFVTTARGVVESYDFNSLIDAVSDRADEFDTYLTSIRGEIRRGIITDPATGEQALGIAISENLQFTGVVHTEDGLNYYEIAPGQTLGLYTSTGWQFWVNGSKRGWFDSSDGSLHVISEVIEDFLQIGDGWRITTVGGFGVRRA